MGEKVAYLAEGKLYVKAGALAPRPIESPFAANVIERAQSNAERNGWRGRSNPMDPFGAMRWGTVPRQPSDTRVVRITGISRNPAGELVYSLDTGAVGGLFTYDLKEDYENRVFHKQDFQAGDLSHHPTEQLLALSMPSEDGTAHLALLQPGVRGLRRITEGDCVDESPAWVGTGKTLVYQTAGVGRNPQGFATALGPYAIHKLDIESEKLTTVMEDARFDFLVPRMTADGTLYCIRRPYKPTGHHHVSAWRVGLDVLLLPWRLLWTIFAFFNFLSLMFAGKPLTTSGGPKPMKVESKTMMLYGKLIDADKAMKAAEKGQAAALVPEDWELLRIDADGNQRVLAKGVLSFDLSPSGGVVYTNGSEIFSLAASGEQEKICSHKMVERVMVVL